MAKGKKLKKAAAIVGGIAALGTAAILFDDWRYRQENRRAIQRREQIFYETEQRRMRKRPEPFDRLAGWNWYD